MLNTTGLASYNIGGPNVTLPDSADVLQVCYDNDDVYIRCQGLANYVMGPFTGNPNVPGGQDYIFKIPRNPMPAMMNTEMGLSTMGVAVNGVPFYNYSDGRSYNSSTNTNANNGDGLWNQDAWISEGPTMDANGNGHPQQDSGYHYHANPITLYSYPANGHSPIIGYALDGYPIYGPFGYDSPMDSTSAIVRIEPSYQLRNITNRTVLPDGTTSSPAGPAVSNTFPLGSYIEDYEYITNLGHLDEFNGRDCVTPEYPGGTYAYFLSVDSVGDPLFPYMFAGFFYGSVAPNVIGPMAGNNTIPSGVTCGSQNCTLTSTSSSTNVACNGSSDGSATATPASGTSPYAYIWSNGATTATATGLAAGTYTATVTDAAGCTATSSATVSQPNNPLTSTATGTDPSTSTSCDGSVSLNNGGGSPPLTFLWSNGATAPVLNNQCAGTYCATVTDNNGCSAVACATLNNPGCNLTASGSGTDVDCNGNATGSATGTPANGTAPFSYAWSNGATSATATGLAAGTYTVSITDSLACTATAIVTVTEPSPVAANLSAADPSAAGACDGSITAATTGGTPPFTYIWDNGIVNPINLCAGTYCTTITDANGCSVTDCATLTDPAGCDLTSTATGTNVSCNGDTDGAATVLPQNGTTPYTYIWSNGGTAQTETNLGAGQYLVTVTDAAACTAIDTVDIMQPPPINLSLNATDESQQGANDGSITAQLTGGMPPTTYSWSSGASGQTVSNLAPGTYTVTITDGNGCTATETATVAPGPIGIADIYEQSFSMFPNPARENVTVQLSSDGQHTIRVLNAVGALMESTQLSGTQGELSLANLAPGLYYIEVATNDAAPAVRPLMVE